MEHFVTMTSLPPGLTFPPQYAEKLHFDAAHKRLVFQGVMSKADFDSLSRLSDDWGYRRPLEDLFRLSIEDSSRPRLFRRLFSAFTSFGF